MRRVGSLSRSEYVVCSTEGLAIYVNMLERRKRAGMVSFVKRGLEDHDSGRDCGLAGGTVAAVPAGGKHLGSKGNGWLGS